MQTMTSRIKLCFIAKASPMDSLFPKKKEGNLSRAEVVMIRKIMSHQQQQLLLVVLAEQPSNTAIDFTAIPAFPHFVRP